MRPRALEEQTKSSILRPAPTSNIRRILGDLDASTDSDSENSGHGGRGRSVSSSSSGGSS
eukprot:CAMPEP_0115715478 /NCGR_PEP_ID=MMETSP0272-20121206/75815_1 /TAXON_ID=71861 /ORGANISM="Scrippsiella trochoidea, Strain CCMP3099" /LENGTH=59 /DNA_ID=CAMNT_0003157735 /DNA_START=30 /DNA_END=206 /DNA_ORIENTATION=+